MAPARKRFRRCEVCLTSDSSRSLSFRIDVKATLDDLKAIIADKEGIPAEAIAFSLGEQELTERIRLGLAASGDWPLSEIYFKLKVNVMFMSGEAIEVQADLHTDVFTVMTEIQRLTGLWPDQMRIFKGTTRLPRYARLMEFDVHKDPTLSVFVKQLGPFKIFDQENGELFTMVVDPEDSFKDIKRRLSEDHSETPAESISLYHDGDYLADDYTLAQYNLDGTSTIEAIFHGE